MPKLVLVRHGESEANAQQIFAGQLDYPLTELGREQAIEAGKILQHHKFDRVFASTLSRASDTAQAILDHSLHNGHLELEIHEHIKERSSGDFQGKHKHDCPDFMQYADFYDKAFPGGESMQMIEDRIKPFFDEHLIPALDQGHDVLLVSHFVTMRVLCVLLEHHTREEACEAYYSNAKPVHFEYENGVFKLIDDTDGHVIATSAGE